MPILAIEINDAGVLALTDTDRPLALPPPSPGFALLEDDGLVTGGRALRRARLNPPQVNNTFWAKLDRSPVGRPFPRSLSHADLAYAHLSAIWEARREGVGTVVLALPGSFTHSQLELLLGLARASNIPVVGLVDAAVAACSGGQPGEQLLHVDLQLHRTVLTSLRQQGDGLEREFVEIVSSHGLVWLLDRLARWIAGEFVRTTRFDPLHAAASEQALYDRLPGLLQELRRGMSTLLCIEGQGGEEYRVELERNGAVECMRPFLAAIAGALESMVRPGAATVLLSHRIGSLPGVGAELTRLAGSAAAIALPEYAAPAGALREADQIRSRGEALRFITRLVASGAGAEVRQPREPAPETGTAPKDAWPSRPTHVLYRGVAYPLSGKPFVLGAALPGGCRGLDVSGSGATNVSQCHCSLFSEEGRVVVEDHSTEGSFVNGERVRGEVELVVGDRLLLGSSGIELELIRVAEGDEASER